MPMRQSKGTYTYRWTMHDDCLLMLWPLEAFGGGIFVTLQSVKQTWKNCTACGDYSMWRLELKILIYSLAKLTKSTFLICILKIDWPRWTAWRYLNHKIVWRMRERWLENTCRTRCWMLKKSPRINFSVRTANRYASSIQTRMHLVVMCVIHSILGETQTNWILTISHSRRHIMFRVKSVSH